MEFTLENMCRTCMNEEGSMFSVYDREERIEINTNYADMLMSFASIQIEKEDGLPKQICQYCLRHLVLAYTFKQTSERSDATFREITKDPEIEFIKEEINDTYSDIEIDLKHSSFSSIQDFETNKKVKVKTEQLAEPSTNDFKLTAEFLDDDFHVVEAEHLELDCNIKFEDNNDNMLEESDFEKQTTDSDDIQMIFNSIKNSHSTLNFTPNIEQLKKSVLKPKSRPTRQPIPVKSLQSYIPIGHQVSKLRTPAKQYICPLCSKQFVKYETFRKHKRLHKSLKCELCSKEFRSTHGLHYHMKIHSGVKNYACTFENCTKRFRLKQALDKHLSIHNNEKNHLCPICGKTYAQYDALHYHIRNHSGERPYLCVHCGKTFKQSCHLKNHMWNHTGIKPHKCKSCGKCYTTGHQLKKHLRKYCNNPANQNNSNVSKDEVITFNVTDHIFESAEGSIHEDEQEDTNRGSTTIYIKCE